MTIKKQQFIDFAEICIEKQKKHKHIDTYLCSFDYHDHKKLAINLSDHCYKGYKKKCLIHSEARLVKNHSCKKIFVVRTRREVPELLMAKPCELCQAFLKNKKIEKVFYSIDNFSYGIFYPQINQNFIKRFGT